MKEIYSFLSDLHDNNNKAWFDKNRERYQDTRKKFLVFTDMLINEVRQLDDDIPFLQAKDCMFRIFRDVRFSKDKRPYKSNYGSFMVKGGRKSGNAGYYIHIEPNGESFVGGGVYCPPSDVLRAIRKEIYEAPEDFITLVEAPGFKAHYPKLFDEDMLKRAPKGFPKDFEHIGLLKYKHYVVVKKIPDEILTGENLLQYIVEAFEAMYDFNRYINRAIEAHKEG